MRSAAAKFGQQGMGGFGELEPNRDQRTVNFDADIAGKFKHQASRITARHKSGCVSMLHNRE